MKEVNNTKEKEFELKYVVMPDQQYSRSKIIGLLISNGFTVVGETDVLNNDYYYDTKTLEYFKSRKSMRIRESRKTNSNEFGYEVTFKSPTGENAKFSTRNEQNDDIKKIDIDEAKRILEKRGICMTEVLSFPVLKVTNNRHIVNVIKNGILVEFAFDAVQYENLINGVIVSQKAIEAESKAKDKTSSSIVLNGIYDSFNLSLPEIMLDTNPNKYYTGLIMTGQSIGEKEINVTAICGRRKIMHNEATQLV